MIFYIILQMVGIEEDNLILFHEKIRYKVVYVCVHTFEEVLDIFKG